MPRKSNPPPPIPPEALEYFRQAGAKGGAIRAALSPEERSEIMRKAWKTRRRKQRETAA